MKKIVLVLFVALMGTMVMNAQPPRGAGRTQDRVEQLTKELGLDKDQKAQIAEILKEGMTQMKNERPALKEGEKPKPPAEKMSRRELLMEQHAAIDAKIVKVLTPEQREKYEQMRLQEQKHEGDKGHGPKDRRHGDRPHGDRPHGDHHKMAPKDGDCCKAGNDNGCCEKNKDEKKSEPTVEWGMI